MDLLIFRTSIKTKKKVKIIKSFFNKHPSISGWSIDLEDIDNVLRIESSGQLAELEIIRQVNICGFQCELLKD